jgi:hypothetical protein
VTVIGAVRGFAALAAAASVLVPVTGRAAAAAPPVRGWIISRTGRGPAVFEGTFTAQPAGYDAAVVTFALTGTGRGRRTDGHYSTGLTAFGSDAWVRVYRPGAPAPACPVAAACANPLPQSTTVPLHSNGYKIDSVVYVAAWDAANPSVTVSTPGWRVRPWRPAMRSVTTDTANATGVSAVQTSVGTFTSAEAAGGPYGSYASVTIPCNFHGRGQATFTGAGRDIPLDCDLAWSAGIGTAGTTRWRVAGNVAGAGWNPHVLLVVDYPRTPLG